MSLTTDDRDLRLNPPLAWEWNSYMCTTSCHVNPNWKCSLRASTQPRILNIFGAH